MIYSQRSKYAIRALAQLASSDQDEYQTIKKITNQSDIPAQFLAKIFQKLVRDGLLKSKKGRGGGFKLASPPTEINLFQIMESVEGINSIYECEFGTGKCNDKDPCPLHESWVPIRNQVINFLKKNSLDSLINQNESQK